MTKRKNKTKETITFPASLLKPIGKFLVEEEKKIIKKIINLKKEDPFADPSRASNNASPDTDAEEQFGHMKNAAIRDQLRRRLVQVRKALTRVKIGNYGTCEKCRQLIDTDRLTIYPEATICIKCLKKEEKPKK
ncbi:MAG: TraR/DksA C4-type zinc finger protein [Candidatus Shapirobacteria bacterium]|nr:TraR/DksA C4-type zinc finger protein [Candidatus Shapirobacteria bacterium]